ncbi:MAG: NUDIX domain-containing protein [Myxococcales bacterium]|nr:NUDIX domain-containing protein [Myxococcales bacterium]
MSTRRHPMFLLDEDAPAELVRLRERWDPSMAARVPPHVTLAYPEETSDERLLLQRAAAVARDISPFTITLGPLAAKDGGRGGVCVSVGDPTGSWSHMRAQLLRPPLLRLEVSAHATIVHPRTSNRGAEAWGELSTRELGEVAMLREVCFTETSAHSDLCVLERFALEGRERRCCVGLLLVEANRCLMALRNPARKRYPNVWDLPGGHMEPGESHRTSTVREAREELGIELEPSTLRHVATLVAGAYELTVFSAAHWHGAISNAAPMEHAMLRWVGPSELESLELADPALRPLLTSALDSP